MLMNYFAWLVAGAFSLVDGARLTLLPGRCLMTFEAAAFVSAVHGHQQIPYLPLRHALLVMGWR
jgi:hypothetical protein